jgi:hypothetical protein
VYLILVQTNGLYGVCPCLCTLHYQLSIYILSLDLWVVALSGSSVTGTQRSTLIDSNSRNYSFDHPQTALCKRTAHMSSLLAISDHALYISHPSQSYNSICRTRLEEANDSARYWMAPRPSLPLHVVFFGASDEWTIMPFDFSVSSRALLPHHYANDSKLRPS